MLPSIDILQQQESLSQKKNNHHQNSREYNRAFSEEGGNLLKVSIISGGQKTFIELNRKK
jgi:hypothetical protein